MFTKNYEVKIESANTMDLIKILGHYGLKFEVGDEYIDYTDPERKWFRDLVIRATKQQMSKLREAIRIKVL